MKAILTALAGILAAVALNAQSPAPLVVQAVAPQATPPPAAPATAPVSSTDSAQAALAVLQEIKATNEAVLAKQAATLQVLDELEKAAEQIKMYSKRG